MLFMHDTHERDPHFAHDARDRVWIQIADGSAFGGCEYATPAEAMRCAPRAPAGSVIVHLATGRPLHMRAVDGSWISMMAGAKCA